MGQTNCITLVVFYRVPIGSHTSSTVVVLSTGAPKGCVLSPFLFTLCTMTDLPSVGRTLLYVDSTTLTIRSNTNNNETSYQEENNKLAE